MDDVTIWIVIIGLGLGSYLIRLSFIGLIGDRPMPEWLLRHLRYAAVGILPGIAAPLVVFPAETGGNPDPVRLLAGLATIVVGYLAKSTIWAIIAGGGTFAALTLLGFGG